MYRDEYERCPRCHAELVDAGSVRACTVCQGQWATHEVLLEMATTMTHPDRPRLAMVPDPSRAPLGCPVCGQAMGTWKLFKIEVDRCEPHGMWFDRDELEHVLFATFDPAHRRQEMDEEGP